MFNLINFCKFFANNKIITTGSRASVGTMKRTSDDRLYFSILGQKIELIYDGSKWQPAAPELFGQEEQAEEQAQEQAQEERQQEQEQQEQEERQQEQEQQEQEEQEEQEQEQEQEQEEEQEQKNFCRAIEISTKIETFSAKSLEEGELNFSIQTNFSQKFDVFFSSVVTSGLYNDAQARVGGELYSFVVKKYRFKGDLRLFVFVYKNRNGAFVGLVKCKNPLYRGIEVPSSGYFFEKNSHFTKQERSIEQFLTCILKSQKAVLACISNKTFGRHDIDVVFQTTPNKFVPIKKKLVKLGKELTRYKGSNWRVLFENGSSYDFLREWYHIDREHNLKYCRFLLKNMAGAIIGTLKNDNPTNIHCYKWDPTFDEAFDNGFYFLPELEQEEYTPAPELKQEEPTPAPELKQEEYTPAPELKQEEPTPAPIAEQEEPTPAPELKQEEYTPAPELKQEEPTPAPIAEQEEPTSPFYRYFETKEGSSIGVCKIGEDTIIGIVDKAGTFFIGQNLGKQGKKRVKYTIFGDDQQLNSKELGSIHGALIEARNFLQVAKKAKKPAKVEIKAAFLGQDTVKIAKIQLKDGMHELTVPTTAGKAIPKTEHKE